jgi:predicted nucleic acid-binding protein
MPPIFGQLMKVLGKVIAVQRVKKFSAFMEPRSSLSQEHITSFILNQMNPFHIVTPNVNSVLISSVLFSDSSLFDFTLLSCTSHCGHSDFIYERKLIQKLFIDP